MQMKLTKRGVIYGGLTIIILGVSAYFIGSIIKQEMKKGASKNSENVITENNVPVAIPEVKSKDDANQSIKDLDSLADSIEQDSLELE